MSGLPDLSGSGFEYVNLYGYYGPLQPLPYGNYELTDQKQRILLHYSQVKTVTPFVISWWIWTRVEKIYIWGRTIYLGMIGFSCSSATAESISYPVSTCFFWYMILYHWFAILKRPLTRLWNLSWLQYVRWLFNLYAEIE